MRLQKYIAQSGVTSRRKAEELIKLGRVKVNGEIVQEMGVVINPDYDTIYVDHRRIMLEEKKIYIMLNKPEGYVTTLSDEFNRPTVIDLVKDVTERIYPIGRLDFDTSGLLLMTNDGDLAYQLTHPKHVVWKTYIAKIKGIPTKKEIDTFKNGVDIGGYVTAQSHIRIIKSENQSSLAEVMIYEGKNRQIRRMFDKINHPVINLKRLAMGNLEMDKLKKGQWRLLTDKEVSYLKSL